MIQSGYCWHTLDHKSGGGTSAPICELPLYTLGFKDKICPTGYVESVSCAGVQAFPNLELPFWDVYGIRLIAPRNPFKIVRGVCWHKLRHPIFKNVGTSAPVCQLPWASLSPTSSPSQVPTVSPSKSPSLSPTSSPSMNPS